MKKALTVIILLFTLFWGGQQIMAQENINIVIKNFTNDDFPKLSFEITPNNDFGVPLDELTTENFILSDDAGQLEATINELTDEDEPIAIMLVLDASGSMQQSGRLNELQNQAVQFRESLNQFDQMGVLFFNIEDDEENKRVALFNSADEREFPPSLDGGAAINFINQFSAGDDLAGTPLYDAMFRSVQVLARDTLSDRRAVIVITDGIDHAQGAVAEDQAGGEVPAGSIHADMDIVLTTAQQENIPIFTIGLTNGEQLDDDSPLSGVNAVELTKIARSTGGTEAIDQSAAELEPVLDAIKDRLKTKYTVSTEALTEPDNQEHVLTIQVNSKVGTSEIGQTFRALYPLQPIIELSYLDNEGKLHENAQDLTNGVSGTVEFRPTFFSRNGVSEVEYFIADALVHRTTTPPFYFTKDLSPHFAAIGAFTDFKIIAIDNSGEKHTSEFEIDMLILECGLTCLAAENNFTTLDTNTFIAIWVALLLLILLLIFFIVFSLVRRRRRKAAEAALIAQGFNPYQQYPMPVIPKTDEQINVGPLSANPAPVRPPQTPAGDTIVDSSFTPGSADSGHNNLSGSDYSSASPATEVLVRPPSQLAFLFNPNNGQQHQLNDPEMTIGRLPENRICMPDPAVSGKHAVIKIENDSYVIYDLGASNPILINGQSIFGSHPLANGDHVTIGREEWVFKEIDQ